VLFDVEDRCFLLDEDEDMRIRREMEASIY
jgi:hypothetical protein